MNKSRMSPSQFKQPTGRFFCMIETLGILGGMGPLASAEFLKTLYEFNIHAKEQTAPRCILHSDPTIPDRTAAILNGNTFEVKNRILDGLEKLSAQGATRFVIACISSHSLIPQLPIKYQRSILSLIEVALNEVRLFPGNCLLLATTGTIRAESFKLHPLWSAVKGKLLIPDALDQARIHDYIYQQIKLNRDLVDAALLKSLREKYHADAFVAGCTEFHLVNKKLLTSGDPDFRFIDPLYSIGRELPSLLRTMAKKET
jgi:aspartate racemase